MSTISTLFGEVIQTKICIKCNEEKPLSKFAPRTRDKNGNPTEHRNDCTDCQKEKSKEVSDLKKNHAAPDVETYVCPLCLRDKDDLAYTKWKNPFVLDHDHDTGEARGWICQDCNTAIARLHDNTATARRMISYMESKDRTPYLITTATL